MKDVRVKAVNTDTAVNMMQFCLPLPAKTEHLNMAIFFNVVLSGTGIKLYCTGDFPLYFLFKEIHTVKMSYSEFFISHKFKA